jgi:hypothetical protein
MDIPLLWRFSQSDAVRVDLGVKPVGKYVAKKLIEIPTHWLESKDTPDFRQAADQDRVDAYIGANVDERIDLLPPDQICRACDLGLFIGNPSGKPIVDPVAGVEQKRHALSPHEERERTQPSDALYHA